MKCESEVRRHKRAKVRCAICGNYRLLEEDMY